jgi:hypothetical protein
MQSQHCGLTRGRERAATHDRRDPRHRAADRRAVLYALEAGGPRCSGAAGPSWIAGLGGAWGLAARPGRGAAKPLRRRMGALT